jgi:hypothetical protein
LLSPFGLAVESIKKFGGALRMLPMNWMLEKFMHKAWLHMVKLHGPGTSKKLNRWNQEHQSFGNNI